MIGRMSHPLPPGSLIPYTAYPMPVPVPEGHGVLIVSFNRGPYIVSAASTSKLKIDGRQVPFGGEGTYYVLVPAGPHEVKVTDPFGMPMIKTALTVHPGAGHQLAFRFGGWRNRVFDGQGADVTTFGMWSNYLIMLVFFPALFLLCCGGVALISALGSSA
ncbi:hypothetical protein GCM10009662_25190 [Catellatospora coxensis]|uniref:Uncharacterized protein n=2 Tax=Catellatospora coxensis TaxID=310354 RepID=A0A8J3KV49_9ACTN|nr:hypothetical protein Cco03nite_34630 [Catellatospora coxensis]